MIGIQMRHPCVKNCVPNDITIDQNKTIILTGPNMGGKSTYIRTIGVCTYLAHLGMYVPAMTFECPVIDAIICRVGASDQQIKGISTFMG
jgi:DNA mismatch repair protein MSH2